MDKKADDIRPEKAQSDTDSVRDIAGNVAAITNSILMGIQGNISLLMVDVDADRPEHNVLKKIEKYIQRGVLFTDGLLDFSESDDHDASLNDLKLHIEKAFRHIGSNTSQNNLIGPDPGVSGSIMINPMDIIDVYEELTIDSKTVLLVDDEEMIIEIGKKMLEKLNLNVLTAADGKEALNIYKLQKNKIDIVILDLKMPGMDGGETYDKIKEIDQDVKVLLASGYGTKSHVNKILSRGCNGFIKKPYKIEALSKKIKEILEKSP